MTKWKKIAPESLPPEGEMLLTKIDDERGCRNKQELCRKGGLWFVDTDLSMYVYYRPTHWAYVAP